MFRDPVCGMKLTDKTAKFKLRYEGEYYYFCSVNCKRRFKRNKIKYGK
jgi:Cu+-exporting ATPase